MGKFQKIILAILFVVGTLSLHAQRFKNASITLNNSNLITGNASISSEKQSIEVKNNNKISYYSFDQVAKFSAYGRTFQKMEFNDITYFTHELIRGKASLFQIEKRKYLISTEDNRFIVINSKDNGNIERGKLTVIFNDCNSLRENIYKVNSLSESYLKILVTEYNSCNYGEFSPTEKEINMADQFNTDEFKVFVGAGLGLRNVSFFENSSTESLNQFGFKVGVAATPTFLGNLKGNLYFNIEASAFFGSEKDFKNAPSPTSFSVNTYRMVFGLDYYFNKHGKIKPYLGMGIGISGDYFEGNVSGDTFDINGGSPIWMPKAGIMYTLNNGKDISLAFDYIPEYENNLSFPVGEDQIIPLIVNSSYFNIGLNYYF